MSQEKQLINNRNFLESLAICDRDRLTASSKVIENLTKCPMLTEHYNGPDGLKNYALDLLGTLSGDSVISDENLRELVQPLLFLKELLDFCYGVDVVNLPGLILGNIETEMEKRGLLSAEDLVPEITKRADGVINLAFVKSPESVDAA